MAHYASVLLLLFRNRANISLIYQLEIRHYVADIFIGRLA